MSMLDRLKNAVLGNPVEREYEIGKHVASAGPGLQWRVHHGTKKTTRQEVSVFLFNKKTPELEKTPKKQREQLFEMLRRGPQQLAKLRHPQLLTVEHSLEETRDSLAFVTEPVTASLANVLGQYDNLPSPLPFAIKQFDLEDVEKRIGLLGILGGLQFVHNDAKMCHGNVTPENIIIVRSGVWKLSGFHFSVFVRYQAGQGVTLSEWDSKAPLTQPSLDYLAPEYVMQKNCDTASDMYAFGLLVYSVYNKGQLPAHSNNNLLTFQHNVEKISRLTPQQFGSVPHEAHESVKQCLTIDMTIRPDAIQMSKTSFFNDASLSTLQYLDTLMQRTDLEKSKFFKTLHRVLTKLPKRVQLHRILPQLFAECKKPAMVPFVLPNVLLVGQDCSLDEFSQFILPGLIPTFSMQEPIQIMLMLLKKMDLLLLKTPQHDVKNYILPMIYRALESPSEIIQELVVTILPDFASMIDYSSLKHHITPRLTNLCLTTTLLKIRVNSLVCIGRLLEHMDKWMVQESIMPTVQSVPSREPGVLMAMLGIYKEIMNNKKLGLEKNTLASNVIPFLFPLAVEPSLNVNQFSTFMAVLRDMIHTVEMEHMAHLKELAQLTQETESSLQYAEEAQEAKAMDDMIQRMEEMFSEPPSEPSAPAPAPQKFNVAVKPAAAAPSSDGDDLFAGLLEPSVPSAMPKFAPPPAASTPAVSSLPAKASPTLDQPFPPPSKVLSATSQLSSQGGSSISSSSKSGSADLRPSATAASPSSSVTTTSQPTVQPQAPKQSPSMGGRASLSSPGQAAPSSLRWLSTLSSSSQTTGTSSTSGWPGGAGQPQPSQAQVMQPQQSMQPQTQPVQPQQPMQPQAQPVQPQQPLRPSTEPMQPQQPMQPHTQPFQVQQSIQSHTQPMQPQQPIRSQAQPMQPQPIQPQTQTMQPQQPVQSQQPIRPHTQAMRPMQQQQPMRLQTQPIQPQQPMRPQTQPMQPMRPQTQPMQPQQPMRPQTQPMQPMQPQTQPMQPSASASNTGWSSSLQSTGSSLQPQPQPSSSGWSSSVMQSSVPGNADWSSSMQGGQGLMQPQQTSLLGGSPPSQPSPMFSGGSMMQPSPASGFQPMKPMQPTGQSGFSSSMIPQPTPSTNAMNDLSDLFG